MVKVSPPTATIMWRLDRLDEQWGTVVCVFANHFAHFVDDSNFNNITAQSTYTSGANVIISSALVDGT